MSDNEFTFIEPGTKTKQYVTINPSSARFNALAHAAIGDSKWVTLESSSKLMVKITPCDEGNRHAISVDPSHQLGRLSAFVRDKKCRYGRYPVEVRDGSLYFQLEPNP